MTPYQKWKKEAAKRLMQYAKNTNPYRVKYSKFYLFIDEEKFTYGLFLRGCTPDAGAVRGYSAPVAEWYHTGTYRDVRIPGVGWRSVDRERVTTRSQGVKAQDVEYYGTSSEPRRFFGVPGKKHPRAFGVTSDDVVVPVYSDSGLVDWLMSENVEEVYEILTESGYEYIDEEVDTWKP